MGKRRESGGRETRREKERKQIWKKEGRKENSAGGCVTDRKKCMSKLILVVDGRSNVLSINPMSYYYY